MKGLQGEAGMALTVPAFIVPTAKQSLTRSQPPAPVGA